VNYDLCVANGTTIPTYGWLPLSLNQGLCRDFTWRFVVADVTQPLIEFDFLSHYGLLVDCKEKRLLDGITSLSALTKQLIRGFPVSKSSVPVHQSTTFSPSFKTSLAPLEFNARCVTTPSTTSSLHQPHQSPVAHVDYHWTGLLLPKRDSTPCCEMAQLAAPRVLDPPHFTLCKERRWLASLRRL
jgi:hypothetical protein